MAPDVTRWLLAFIAATLIALVARSRRSLGNSGVFAAIGTGTTLVGTAGWWAGLLLVLFFASSSLLSTRKTKRSSIAQPRGSQRDAVQVLANGGVAVVAGILLAVSGNHAWSLMLAGALAGANADTWSTEIGRTSRSLPRLVTTLRQVTTGTSGAVSLKGLAGALGGGALIGGTAALGWWTGWFPGSIAPVTGLIIISVAGFAGSLWDSLMGATLQDQRWCDTCQTITERRVHRCGATTRNVRGFEVMTNDVVNVSCTLVAGGVGWLLASLFT